MMVENRGGGRTPREFAVYEAMTAAARADDGWSEVDNVIESLDAQNFEIVSYNEAFAISALRRANAQPWWAWRRRRWWVMGARSAVQLADSESAGQPQTTPMSDDTLGAYCEAQVGGMECGQRVERWGQQCKRHDPNGITRARALGAE